LIISILQPCFIPWLGYFEQIAIADKFVYLDDVQYNRRNWRNNNQLKSPNGKKEVCVSVNKPPFGTAINKVEIAYHLPWASKFLNQLYNWYGKTKYFDQVLNLITPHLELRYSNLAVFNQQLNQSILNYLEIDTPIYRSSSIPTKADNKIDRILEICTHFEDISILFDGKKAQDFLSKDTFSTNGIEVLFQDYKHTPYPQLWGQFEPYMSILDCLFNCGKDAVNYIISEQSLILLDKK